MLKLRHRDHDHDHDDDHEGTPARGRRTDPERDDRSYDGVDERAAGPGSGAHGATRSAPAAPEREHRAEGDVVERTTYIPAAAPIAPSAEHEGRPVEARTVEGRAVDVRRDDTRQQEVRRAELDDDWGAVPARRTTRTAVTWGIGQLLALAVGIGLLIVGSMALARSGLDVNHLYSPHVEVGGLHHTPLLGLVEVVFGLIAIAAAAIPGTVRTILALLGIVALGAGIGVLVYTGTELHDRFGVHDFNGWVYVAAGAVLLLAVMLPTTRERRVRVRRRRR